MMELILATLLVTVVVVLYRTRVALRKAIFLLESIEQHTRFTDQSMFHIEEKLLGDEVNDNED
ncbi:hypothetical protein LH506_04405 [Lapidilactobacillus dextrinicus]|uniref:hypothetical protein n=1 Tax=Lapidilactobacillus dextrinicus TaxID=51664 RepID=UPI00070B0344|nr:hypothetical protein [Lapidilactobacillus dextrinicus]QFG46732.1 hypothetical protein LH506_04405 [Lapidilactobacillus dextrinicus]